MCDRNSADRDILNERDRILSAYAGTTAPLRDTGGLLGPSSERDLCAKQGQNACKAELVPQTYRELHQHRNVLLREQEALRLKLTIIDQMLSVF